MKRKALMRLVENARNASYLPGACKPGSQYKAPPVCNNARGGAGAHFTAGSFGIKWVLMALADSGMQDLAHEMVTSKTYPNHGWMMNNPFANATDVWESFDFSDSRYSHNHPMFSSLEVWLLQSVAGIQPHPFARGMGRLLIKPNPPSQLCYASASFESPRGVTTVSWRRSSKGYALNVTISQNCRATVYVPAERCALGHHNGSQTTLSNNWVPSLVDINRGSSMVEIGSGRHEFDSFSIRPEKATKNL